MRIGWNGGGHHTRLESIRDEARRAAVDGFANFWLSQITGPDALTALAAVAAGATDLRVNALCATPAEAERTHAFLNTLCAAMNRS